MEKFLKVLGVESACDRNQRLRDCEADKGSLPEIKPSSTPRAAPIIPKEKTANHSRQLRTSLGSSARVRLRRKLERD